MLVSVSWLKRYVDINVPAKTLASDLTMLGLNVERSQTTGVEEKAIVIGRVLEVGRHPDADRLSVCRVDVGTAQPLDVVCGAPNVAAGQFVPVALDGAQLPDGTKIRRSKIRGVVSNGMICSEIELGLGDDANGIMVLDGKHVPGTPASEVLGASDTIFEIEITPNRPDHLSHLGVAREIAARYETAVRYPFRPVDPGPARDGLTIDIESPPDCPRYVGRVVRNLTVAPSPAWLRNALEQVGVNSINNVVDISNYVMLEMGQPLHAFDVSKLGGLKIAVRRGRASEHIRALNDVVYQLNESQLIITGEDRPVAVAGVIGGLETAVTAETTDILLESAAFDPRLVRKTRKSMNISTEASYRFERGADRTACRTASDRACELVMELCGGTPGELVDAYPNPPEPRTVRIRRRNTQRILGIDLEVGDIARLLERLHFENVRVEDDAVTVDTPSFRLDITEEMDLIEEVARLYGYERIGKGWDFHTTTFGRLDPFDELVRSVTDHLVSRGFTEVITSSFADGSEPPLMGWAESDPRRRQLEIRNPLTSNQRYLRSSLLPGVVELIRRNFDYGMRCVSVFHIGKTFVLSGAETGLPEERWMLLLATTRPDAKDFWNQFKLATDLFDIKAEIESLGMSQNIDIQGRLGYHFDREAGTFTYADRRETVIEGGIVPAGLAHALALEQAVWYAQIDLAKLFQLRSGARKFKPLPEYPVSKRDLSLVTSAGISYGDIEKSLVRSAGRLLESVQVFDVYRGPSLPEAATAYGVRLIFRSPERTLTDAEIDNVLEKVIQKLRSELGVTLRS